MATLYFKWLYPNAVIHAFEPDPQAYALLCANIRQNNLTNVRAENVALTDRDGEIALFTDRQTPASLTSSISSARMPGTAVLVKSARLSPYVDRSIDLLKLDIEGAEEQVLAELSRSWRLGHIHQLVIEYHHHIPGEKAKLSHFLAQLEKCGFEYQISAAYGADKPRNSFQDITIYAYQSSIEQKLSAETVATEYAI